MENYAASLESRLMFVCICLSVKYVVSSDFLLGRTNYQVTQERLMSFLHVQTSPLCPFPDILRGFLIVRWQFFKVR